MVKLAALTLDQAFEENLVLLNDRLFVTEVLLFQNMFKDATPMVFNRQQQLCEYLSVSKARRCYRIEHIGKLVDTLALMSLHLRFNDTLRNCTPNLHKNVGETFDTARILLMKPPCEL